MSAQKTSGDSLSVKGEEEALNHFPTFTSSATTDDPSFPPRSLFDSLHDGGGTQGDLHEFARDLESYREPSCHNHGEGASNVPIKWMSSKMRLMKKLMGSDQIPMNKTRRRMSSPLQDRAVLNQEISNGNISPSCIVRVCSDCNTTKTPLWRSGPRGPKSLCNACGIRQMKARRALMAANVTSTRKEKNSGVDRTVPYKKRYKFTNHGKTI
ncbi:hypothetical protein HPP92_005235 [Vanilla planifolia]|uniref:GATA-type domain-containing protein n=1 Tax=Vanilla planifolia TaxID=51239 RepID=A0A835RLB4_VANPL|nr:hypothetical protein HPP92_005235 [Vanilla planifolia]